jgi:hypothetical protein
MRNCPPFGLECHESHSELHVCRRTKICPWCFARYHAANPLFRLADYLSEAAARNLVLVSFHRGSRYAPRGGIVGEVLQQIESERSCEVWHFRAEAAVVVNTFLLTNHQFGFYRRGFLFARPGMYVREAEASGLVRVYPPNISSLHRAGPSVFRYPASLFYGEPSWTVTTLERSNNRRMLVHYGGLRNASPREIVRERTSSSSESEAYSHE